MTSGVYDRGNGVTYPNWRVFRDEKSWGGSDSFITKVEPHSKYDPQSGRFYTVYTKVLYNAPLSTVGRTVNVFGLTAERLRVMDAIVDNALHAEERVPLSFLPNGKRKPKRSRFRENPYVMHGLYRSDFQYAYHLWGFPVAGNCSPADDYGLFTVPDAGGMTAYASNANARSLLTANDEIKLINRLREKIRGSDFNLAVALGEGHQALTMITVAATRIANSLKYLKRGDLKAAVKHLIDLPSGDKHYSSGDFRRLDRKVSREALDSYLESLVMNGKLTRKEFIQAKRDLRERSRLLKQMRGDPEVDFSRSADRLFSAWWLELSYGWLPLIADIDDGAKMLAHQLNVPLQKTYKASIRVRQNQKRVTSWPHCPGYQESTGIGFWLHRKSIIARMSEPEAIPKLLGMLNLESVVWELTPWSFVSDWVIPLGDFLEARGFAQGLTGTFVISDVRKAVADAPQGDHVVVSVPGPDPFWTETFFDRTVVTSLDVPFPAVKPLNKIASWQHCANAIALLISGNSQGNPRYNLTNREVT